MAAFDYVALDLAGKRREGVIRADDEAQARAALEKRQLAPVKLAPTAQAETGRTTIAKARLSPKQLALATRQLATLAAVAPLEESLRTMALQADERASRVVLDAVHGGVVEGLRLADAMGRQGKSFPPLYRAMIAAGEGAGALPQVLERLADLLERQAQIRGKIIGALIYPAVLTLVAAIVVIALMTFVIPRIVEQFDSLGQDLPPLTNAVIFVSTLLREWGWLIALTLGAAGFGLARLWSDRARRAPIDRFLLRLPFIGRMQRDIAAASLARTLATMIASGLPLLEGLAITARTVDNAVLRNGVETMASAIREGASLSAAMRKAGLFPPLLVYMAASGENAGRLDHMLDRAADHLEREFNTFTAAALALLEPLIIVVMGGVVATIVLSIVLPLLRLNAAVLG